jgi:hypothetical protein
MTADRSVQCHPCQQSAPKERSQRARARLEELAPPPTRSPSRSSRNVVLLDRYIAVFENSDAAALELALRQEVTLELPPSPTWFTGGAAAACATGAVGSPGDWRMVPTAANAQPAAAAYHLDGHGGYRAYAIVVLTVTTAGIARITVFGDPALSQTSASPRSSRLKGVAVGGQRLAHELKSLTPHAMQLQHLGFADQPRIRRPRRARTRRRWLAARCRSVPVPRPSGRATGGPLAGSMPLVPRRARPHRRGGRTSRSDHRRPATPRPGGHPIRLSRPTCAAGEPGRRPARWPEEVPGGRLPQAGAGGRSGSPWPAPRRGRTGTRDPRCRG